MTYLQDARKAKAEVRPFSTVTRVLTNPGRHPRHRRRVLRRQEAKAGAGGERRHPRRWSAQNPRILLNSATDKHPKGLANKNDLVGKYMMTHSIAGTWALFDEDITPHMGTIGAQFMSYDRYAKTELSERVRLARSSWRARR